MKRNAEHRVMLLTNTQSMAVDSARYIHKMANNMRAVGYSTAIVNLGPGIPRPTWLVPPYFSVAEPQQLHKVLERLSPSAIIATDWQTAFVAFDESARRQGRAYHFVDGLGLGTLDDIVTAGLLRDSYRLGPVLYHSPGLLDSVKCMGAKDPHRLKPGVDDAFFDAVRAAQPCDIVFFSSPEDPKQDDLIIEGFLQSEARAKCRATLRSIGYFPNARRDPATVAHIHLPWQDDNSAPRARELGDAICMVSMSPRDGTAICVLEAMACGCPVVALRSGGTNHLCTEENCILVDSPDANAIALAIDALARDASLRERLASAGRRTVEGFHWTDMLDSLPNELKEFKDPERAYGLGMPRWNP